MRIDPADWCRLRARSRGYKICCIVDGHKGPTYCIADLRPCFERKDLTASAKVQSRACPRLVSMSGSFAAARAAAFVIGRGFGLGPVREIALKFTETMQLPISSYGAAEVRHASASAETPLLVLRQKHGSSEMVDALIADLRVRKKSGWA